MATINAPSPSPAPSPGATLSAVIAEDRRREARRHPGGLGQGGLLPLLVPACGRPAGQAGGRTPQSQLMLRLHRWGASFLPKGGAVSRELEAARRAPSPPPRARPSPIATAQTDTSDESPQSLSDSPALAVETADKFVWADKYRPSVFNDFSCNKAVAAELYQLAVAHQCKHFIFEGPPSVGKRSMVLALIRDGFGPHDLKIEEQIKRFELKGEIRKHIDVRVKISGHHVEVNLADLHGYEKYVITTLLNESMPSPNSVCDHTNCRVVVIHDADKLSSDLQHYIGWFLGRHLCKVVTLQPPSFDEIIKVLEYIATQESIDLPRDLAKRITVGASNNLRQAIRSFEATSKANYPFVDDQVILTGWEEEISNVARNIMEDPSSKQLFVIRGKIRKLIEHSVSPHFIFSHLVAELKRDKDEEFQHSIDELALNVNHCKQCKLIKEQCKGCKSPEADLKMRNMNIEGFTENVHDHGENIQCFIKIEEFTVRFLSFYRSLIAKKSNSGGAQ
ncbi:hypothetical protein C2845_PM02G19220 [Panicum miliaceum]|uniref:Replication factor C subunit 3 n=1 Tax=Panicum miliaceum TaxID=4540 RepID=A0A3L6SFK3_PANMI|nr:hypothetical protein C2845_PM02G19220 [Panicum miliaceum]